MTPRPPGYWSIGAQASRLRDFHERRAAAMTVPELVRHLATAALPPVVADVYRVELRRKRLADGGAR